MTEIFRQKSYMLAQTLFFSLLGNLLFLNIFKDVPCVLFIFVLNWSYQCIFIYTCSSVATVRTIDFVSSQIKCLVSF